MIGAEAHAGPTPMEARRDALRAAAALLERDLPDRARHAPDGRATVGEFQRLPRLAQHRAGPGRASRSTCAIPDGGVMDAMDHALREAFERARGRAHGGRIDCHRSEIWYAPPVAFDPACIDAVRQAAAGARPVRRARS